MAATVFMACKSVPSTEESPAEELPIVEELHEDEEEEPSTNFTVSQEVYDETLAEVRHFVENLNALVHNKDYEGWKNALSDEFFAYISSPEFLAKASESTVLRSQKIVLKTANDYFHYVVVPSRSNSRVDAIEFVATDRVKVFYQESRVRRGENNTTSTEVRRLRLYDLIKRTGDTWKIVN